MQGLVFTCCMKVTWIDPMIRACFPSGTKSDHGLVDRPFINQYLIQPVLTSWIPCPCADSEQRPQLYLIGHPFLMLVQSITWLEFAGYGILCVQASVLLHSF